MTQITLTSIDGNTQLLDGGAMFGNAPRAMWEKWCPPDHENRIALATRGFLIQAHNKNILIEVGAGNFFEPKRAERFGIERDRNALFENLDRHQLKPADIDYVVLSHLHFDHAGGLIPAWPACAQDDWDLNFPNARYLVGLSQFEHAKEPHVRDRASYIPLLQTKLADSQRLVLVDTQQCPINELADVISFHFVDGHTPGQMLTMIHGETTTALFCGDLIPGTPWVHAPITMGYDRFAEKQIDEKQEVLAALRDRKGLALFTHDAKNVAAHVQQNEKGRFEAVNCLSELVQYAL